MRKKIEKAATRYIEFIKKVGVEVIQPFKEKPSIDKEIKDPAAVSNGTEDNRRIAASDLFSLFTADIINEKAVFIR